MLASTSSVTISPRRSAARRLKEHYRVIWWVVWGASALPGCRLCYQYLTDGLGTNPLQYLQQTTGQIALSFLLVSLTITPLRRALRYLAVRRRARHGKRLEDWNWVIRLRRMLGLYCFFYAVMHVLCFVHFDIDYDVEILLLEAAEKPYLAIGMLAAVLLVPLAVTSTNAMIRRLGKNWRRIHRSVYLISLLVIAHYWLSVKPGVSTPVYFTLATAALLGYRIWAAVPRKPSPRADDGMETPERR
jgi:sulfoxide reductase heme-binding subunit YedZ